MWVKSCPGPCGQQLRAPCLLLLRAALSSTAATSHMRWLSTWTVANVSWDGLSVSIHCGFQRLSMCKGPEAGGCLVYLRHSREASGVGVEETERKREEMKAERWPCGVCSCVCPPTWMLLLCGRGWICLLGLYNSRGQHSACHIVSAYYMPGEWMNACQWELNVAELNRAARRERTNCPLQWRLWCVPGSTFWTEALTPRLLRKLVAGWWDPPESLSGNDPKSYIPLQWLAYVEYKGPALFPQVGHPCGAVPAGPAFIHSTNMYWTTTMSQTLFWGPAATPDRPGLFVWGMLAIRFSDFTKTNSSPSPTIASPTPCRRGQVIWLCFSSLGWPVEALRGCELMLGGGKRADPGSSGLWSQTDPGSNSSLVLFLHFPDD